jgi:hypothetical protein
MRERIKSFQVVATFIATLIGANAFAECPDLSLHETIQDCPWAQASRDTTGITDPDQLRAIVDKDIPGFMLQIDRDATSTGLLNLWGLSSNVDVSNLATGLVTIPKNIVQFFVSLWNVPYNTDFTQGSAALNHTYGYLFSNMYTPYGYKRARYVKGELESGFGITPGMFSGLPTDGTLLSNLTYFTGTIAFRDSPASSEDFQDAVTSGQIESIPELVKYPYSSLSVQRLIEVAQNSQFYLELRTDIVNFPHANTEGTNTALLIYSMDFHAPGQVSKPKIITAFPVGASFAAGIFNPTLLGDNVALSLKYNAVLPVTVPAELMVGKRFIANESTSTRN